MKSEKVPQGRLYFRAVQFSWLADYVVAILADKLHRRPITGNQVGVAGMYGL